MGLYLGLSMTIFQKDSGILASRTGEPGSGFIGCGVMRGVGAMVAGSPGARTNLFTGSAMLHECFWLRTPNTLGGHRSGPGIYWG